MEQLQINTFKKVTIQLLQEGKEPSDVLKPLADNMICLHELTNSTTAISKLTYGIVTYKTPSFVFTHNINEDHARQLTESHPYCLYFVKFNPRNFKTEKEEEIDRWMVISNGCGYQLLKQDDLEYRFGLYTALNMIDPNAITEMYSKTTEAKPRSFWGKTSQGDTINRLRMEDDDILKALSGKIHGKCENLDVEISIFGSKSLKVLFKKPQPLQNLPQLCEMFFEKYQEKTYQNHFSLFLEPVFNKMVISALEENLANSIKECLKVNTYIVELSYPSTQDFICSGKIKFIKFGNKRKTVFEELNFENYIAEIRHQNENNIFENGSTAEIIDALKKHFVALFDDDVKSKAFQTWSLKKCIIYNTKYGDDRYILREGIWYEIASNYIEYLKRKLNERLEDRTLPVYDEEIISKIKLPEKPPAKKNTGKRGKKEDNSEEKKKRDMREEKYNIHVAEKMGYLLLDKKNVYIKGQQKFEISDHLSKDGIFGLVKLNGGTEMLGHLFNQGLITGSYLLKEDVRLLIFNHIREIQEELKKDGFMEAAMPNPEKLTFRYVVLYKKEPSLTFNALILFNNAAKKLEDMGYKVKFQWIPMINSVDNVKFTENNSKMEDLNLKSLKLDDNININDDISYRLPLKNRDNDCFLIAAVNAFDCMEEIRNSVLENVNGGNISNTQRELRRVLLKQNNNVIDVRNTLEFDANRQQDVADALFKIISRLDENSKMLMQFDNVITQECGCIQRMKPEKNKGHIITLPAEITFDLMLIRWLENASRSCPKCNMQIIMKNNISLGENQKYFVFELHIHQGNDFQQPLSCMKNFDANSSHVIIDAHWELVCAIEYIGYGTGGHYMSWRKDADQKWIVIDDHKVILKDSFSLNMENCKVLIFKRLG